MLTPMIVIAAALGGLLAGLATGWFLRGSYEVERRGGDFLERGRW